MCVLISSTIIVRKNFHSKKSARCDKKYTTRYCCPILMKLEYSGRFFENWSYIKLNENPSSGSRFVQCGQTDGQTGMTKLLADFRSFTNASKNLHSTA
jgi:hypothetical protein